MGLANSGERQPPDSRGQGQGRLRQEPLGLLRWKRARGVRDHAARRECSRCFVDQCVLTPSFPPPSPFSSVALDLANLHRRHERRVLPLPLHLRHYHRPAQHRDRHAEDGLALPRRSGGE